METDYIAFRVAVSELDCKELKNSFFDVFEACVVVI